jgi:hypothetical protein
MKSLLIGLVIGAVLLAAAATLPAQLSTDDLILSYLDTSTTNAGGRTFKLNLSTSKITTLIDKLTTNPSWFGNWVQMAPDNRSVWVAYSDLTGAGALYAIDQAGRVSTVVALGWRTDGFRLTDDAGLTWSAYGGTPSRTDTLFRTDRTTFQNITTLVTGLPSSGLNHVEIEDTGNYACSSQSTTVGQGAVSEVDPIRKVIVTTVNGMIQANTVDYHRASGTVLVTDVGTASSLSAPVGALYAVDLVRRRYTTIIDPNGPLGPIVDRLNWVECRPDRTILLGARHKVFQFDMTRSRIVSTWVFEKDRSQAITGATLYGNRPLTLDSRQAAPGGTVTITLDFPHNRAAGSLYLLSASFALRPGLPLPGGTVLDLAPDALFGAVVSGALSSLFRNFQGFLTTTGQATARIVIPADPNLRGFRLFVGGVAVVQGQIVPTNCEGFTIR